MNTKLHFSSENDSWETPPEVFEPLNDEFEFTLDVCATKANAKCDDWIGKGDTRLWSGRCFMNPPYGRQIKTWVHHAALSVQDTDTTMYGNPELVCCLLPARTDTRWWHDYIWDATKHRPRPGVEVRFLKGRIKFVGAKHAAPFPSAIVIFHRGAFAVAR